MLSSAESSTLSNPAVARKRYARIPEVLPVPNLIELQLSRSVVHREGPQGSSMRSADQGHRQGGAQFLDYDSRTKCSEKLRTKPHLLTVCVA
jgi:hypothetical protein